MAVPVALLVTIALELIKRFRKRDDLPNIADLLLPQKDLVDGLKRLIRLKDLVIDRKTFSPDMVTAAIAAIRLFQKGSGILLEDGILGPKTLNILRNGIFFLDPTPPSSSAPKIPDRVNPLEVRVFIESLPNVAGGYAEVLFDEAWNSWQLVTQLGYLDVGSLELADVVVRTGKVDGKQGVNLAEADIGPPKTRQLELLFDRDENFTTTPVSGGFVFASVACHEIGHILGLSHRTNSGELAPLGQVMHRSYQAELTEPQSQDIRRAQEIWGKPNSLSDL